MSEENWSVTTSEMEGSEADNSLTAVTGRCLLGSSPASGSGFPWLASQSQQVGSIPIADGIKPEFLARHTVDRDLRDSIDQSAGTVNGPSHWNGALGEAFHMYPGYPVHLAQGSPASNGGIPHGYIWNQSSFQAACSDSSVCPTHVRQPVPTATLTMPSQLCAWDNRLGPVGLIQTSCHGSEADNSLTAVTGRCLLGSSPASGSGFPWLASQSQQVGSIPIADGIKPEFLARHTVDRDLRDSIDQSAGTVNGTSHWNGALGEAFHMYPGYPVHLAQGSPASNGGIPHGYIWNQSSFQAACSDSSVCPTHFRQPVPTATLTMPSQLCAWDNRLGPVGLIQTSCHASQRQDNGPFEHVLRERDGELHERSIQTKEELIREQRARKEREQREMQETGSPQLQQLHTARKSLIQNCLSCEMSVEFEQQEKHLCEPNNCCICLEAVDDFIGSHQLPCRHKVHLNCYILMLQKDVQTCPVCRHPIH